MQRTDILEKIKKLLRLSQSGNIHEAAAAAAKAQELLAKYNVARESIRLEDDPLEAQRIHKKTRQRLEDWAYSLARCCAEAFDCRFYHIPYAGDTVFVGVGADPEVCAWMYGYLYKTLLRLASTYIRIECKRLRSNASRKNARDSFLQGAVAVIKKRLVQQKNATPATSSDLMICKKALIDAAMPHDLVFDPAKKIKIREKDWYAGRHAASNVPLSTPIKQSSPARLALE